MCVVILIKRPFILIHDSYLPMSMGFFIGLDTGLSEQHFNVLLNRNWQQLIFSLDPVYILLFSLKTLSEPLLFCCQNSK